MEFLFICIGKPHGWLKITCLDRLDKTESVIYLSKNNLYQLKNIFVTQYSYFQVIYILNFSKLEEKNIKEEWFQYIPKHLQCILIGFKKFLMDKTLFSHTYSSPEKTVSRRCFPIFTYLCNNDDYLSKYNSTPRNNVYEIGDENCFTPETTYCKWIEKRKYGMTVSDNKIIKIIIDKRYKKYGLPLFGVCIRDLQQFPGVHILSNYNLNLGNIFLFR